MAASSASKIWGQGPPIGRDKFYSVVGASLKRNATLTIRNLDQVVKERLRVRAAERGHSMEAEARRILQTALGESPRPPVRSLYESIHSRFAALGGVDLDLPPRERVREPPQFERPKRR